MLHAPAPVEHAVQQLTDALDTLLDLDLSTLTPDGLLVLLRGVERQRRRLPVADHRATPPTTPSSDER